MKNILIFLAAFIFSVNSYAEDYWYVVRVEQGHDFYDYYGTIKYNEKELAKAIKNEAFIHISKLVYFDNQQKVKNWAEWAPYQKPEIYIKSENIISFMPLPKDPRDGK